MQLMNSKAVGFSAITLDQIRPGARLKLANADPSDRFHNDIYVVSQEPNVRINPNSLNGYYLGSFNADIKSNVEPQRNYRTPFSMDSNGNINKFDIAR